jgi:protein disulfide-isomerase
MTRGIACALLFCAWLLAGCGGETAVKVDWSTDLPKALARAKAEKKLVLIDFTGSDWCQPCKLLEKNVLATRAFADYADAHLVLVQADFPETKPQPEDLKTAFAALAKKFDVEGYPTLILLDADGKVLLTKKGYEGAKTADYITEIDTAAKKG